MPGAMKVIILKIALPSSPTPSSNPVLAGLNQESTHCHSPWSVFFLEGFCTLPGSLIWPLSACVCVTGNNTQGALLSRSRSLPWKWPGGPGWRGRPGVPVKMSISCSNRMQGDGLGSRFSYPDSPDSFSPPLFLPRHHLHLHISSM